MVPGADFTCPPSHCSNVPCHTLQYYAKNSNFTSNAIFYFTEGEHTLETVVHIMNVANLSLTGLGSAGQSSTKVLCGSASAGFIVKNFSRITVGYLSFLHCGAGVEGNRSVFRFIHGYELNVDHVTISNSSGAVLWIVYVNGSSSIKNSIFSYNSMYTDSG